MVFFGFGGFWFGSIVLVILVIVVVGVWLCFGYGMMIIIVVLQDVFCEFEEVVFVDGVNVWQWFWWIIFFYLCFMFFFLVVIEMIVVFQVFDVIYVMIQGGLVNVSYLFVYLLYDQGFCYFDYGYVVVVGVVLFIMIFVVVFIQCFVIGKQK